MHSVLVSYREVHAGLDLELIISLTHMDTLVASSLCFLAARNPNDRSMF